MTAGYACYHVPATTGYYEYVSLPEAILDRRSTALARVFSQFDCSGRGDFVADGAWSALAAYAHGVSRTHSGYFRLDTVIASRHVATGWTVANPKASIERVWRGS